jgi:hypothetical protein
MILATAVGTKGKQLAKRVTQLELPGAAWVSNKQELEELARALTHREWSHIRRWGRSLNDPQWITWGFKGTQLAVKHKHDKQWARSEELLYYVHAVKTDRAHDKEEVARVHEYSKTMMDPIMIPTRQNDLGVKRARGIRVNSYTVSAGRLRRLNKPVVAEIQDAEGPELNEWRVEQRKNTKWNNIIKQLEGVDD